MHPHQLLLDVHNELIIDNFAGGGGAITGIEIALGRHVDIAINHDPHAVAMHRANHPQTRHYCESVWDIDPREVTQGRPVALVWLSPDCKHFSKAKGGKPVEKKIRGLAWIALRWAAVAKPRVIMLENVEEFKTWGPLITDEAGKARPCPKNKGREFKSFCNALKAQGYQVEFREMRASDHGAPTIRKRLFLIARRDGQPIVWPQTTHGDPAKGAGKRGGLLPWKTAADCIDFTTPCPSIFERSRPLADATLRRIAKGIMRYVVNAAEPFIVKYYGEKSQKEFRGSEVNEPLHTQSTENRFALCTPILAEHANASSPRCMPANEPLRTICAQVKGGHRALVSAFLAKHYTGVVGSALSEPVHTVTSVDHNSFVAANLVHMGHGEGADGNKRFSHGIRDIAEPLNTITASGATAGIVTSNMIKLRGDNVGAATDEPLHTISAGGTHHAEVRAFLIKYYGTGQDLQIAEPLHTVTTKDRYGLVTIAGHEYAIADIGLRMLTPRELFRAQGFPEHYIIDHGIDDAGRKIKLTKTAQVRMCGNSVCPPLAAALVGANLVQLSARKAA